MRIGYKLTDMIGGSFNPGYECIQLKEALPNLRITLFRKRDLLGVGFSQKLWGKTFEN